MEIYDNHVHLTSSSIDFFLNVFTKAGGTSLNLVNLTEDCFLLEDFERKYDQTISISKILEEKGLHVVVSIGPYPVNYVEMREKIGKDKALEIYRKAVDSAVRRVEEGMANAIGEVGRPHFPTSQEIVEESNGIMEYIFQSTSDNDIPVILHTESLDSTGMCDVMKMARNSGKE